MKPIWSLVACMLLACCEEQPAASASLPSFEMQRELSRQKARAQAAEKEAAELSAELAELKRGLSQQALEDAIAAAERSRAANSQKIQAAMEEYRRLKGETP